MKPTPLFGAGVYGKSAVVTRQRRVNCYFENRPDGDKSKVVIYGTPGLVYVQTIEIPSGANALRGLFGVNENNLYFVQYSNFILAVPTASGSVSAIFVANKLLTIAGLVSMATNPAGSQVLLVDGVAGYLYTDGSFTVLNPAGAAAWFVPGARTCTNVGGYFVTEIPGTGTFAVSNLNDASTGYALSFASAAAYPDIVIAVDNLFGNLIPFGNNHLEFWQPVGTPPPNQPFAPIQNATAEWGLAAVFSRAHLDQALFFLGKTRQGVKRVCRIDTYLVTPISEEIDYIINQPGFVTSDAAALSYQQDKHAFYQLTFPTMNRSFLYDCSTGIWGESQTGFSTGPYVRHAANLSTYFNGTTYLSDYLNGNLYTMSQEAYTDAGQPVLREVVTRHQLKGFNRFRIPFLYLDMETGVGAANTAGQNPMLSIECSKDNGRTWLQPRLLPLGRIGEFVTRIAARRFGQARVFTFRIRVTDAVKFVITDGAIETKMRAGGTK